jgi:mercuric transport protein
VSPYLVAPSPATATQQTQAAVGQGTGEKDSDMPASFQQVVLDVEGMTCRACPKTVSTALKDVDGVYSVDATYEPPEAVVRFDPDKTSVEALTQATENVGYPSQPKSAS